MFNTPYTTPASDLNQEVRKILEVPPKWVIRNGGFLMLSYVVVICFLFTIINMSPSLITQVKFGNIQNSNSKSRSIAAAFSVANQGVSSLKEGTAVILVPQNGDKEISYTATIVAVKTKKDLLILQINITEDINQAQFKSLRPNSELNCRIQLAKVSLIKGVIYNHLGQ